MTLDDEDQQYLVTKKDLLRYGQLARELGYRSHSGDVDGQLGEFKKAERQCLSAPVPGWARGFLGFHQNEVCFMAVNELLALSLNMCIAEIGFMSDPQGNFCRSILALNDEVDAACLKKVLLGCALDECLKEKSYAPLDKAMSEIKL